ncbi:hypothetical protein OG225_03985 [Nocardia sp. NBC_01377]|uniref:hypothetical protein n=1 Tax=Nocardia sp. NBC_01377 TaxID=2903595 RepID=UPI003249040F
MATVHPSSVDIAGTAWPVYKLEALAAGLLTCLILALITGSAQLAVLIGAAILVTRWSIGYATTRRHPVRRTHRVLSAH